MSSRFDTGSPSMSVATTAPRVRTAAPAAPDPVRSPWFLIAISLLVAILLNPLLYSSWLAGWYPPVGLGLAFAAWFGWRFALGILLASGALVLTWTASTTQGLTGSMFAWITCELLLAAVEPVLAWRLYREAGRGSPRLADPGSATLFVVLVPGVVAFAVALIRTLIGRWLGQGVGIADSLGMHLARNWLEHALGVMVLAPPLLVAVTPWLARHGLLRPDARRGSEHIRSSSLAPLAAEPPGPLWGDWVEIGGLAFGASVLCGMLSRLQSERELLGWQIWGVQLLLIVWASMRQGLRGGTIVATMAALTPLFVSFPGRALPRDSVFQVLLQAHLFAQCSAALLIASASSWVRMRETGYQQVVAHIPVMIYSARLLREPGRVGPGGIEAHGLAELTLVSAASGPLVGCHPEQLLGDYTLWLARVHHEDREVLLAALEQLARQDQPVICEYRVAVPIDPVRAASESSLPGETVTAPRSLCWLRDTLVPHRDSDGRLIGWEGVVTNITEQRTLADDLRRTTSMFHALVSNLPTGVFFVQGPHGQPILVNARARQLLGQREDAAASLEYLPRVYRLFRQDGSPYPAEELPVFLALRQGRTTMRDDIVVHRPDGRRIPLITWAAPVQLGPRGGPDAAVWVLEDLTALHQAEAARKDTEGRLHAIIQTMAEGLLVHDARGVVTNCNPAACALFNMAEEKLRGRTLAEIPWRFFRENGDPLPPEDYPAQLALRVGRPVRNVVLGVQMRGAAETDSAAPRISPCTLSVRWLLLNAMPLGLATGTPAERKPPSPGSPKAVVTTFSDVTAYIHAREAIRTSEERHRGLIESLPLMLVQTDRNMRVTYANPATLQSTGYTLEEMADPAAWSSFIHPDDLARTHEMARNALNGKPDRTELRYRARDGSEKVIYAFAQPRWQNGEVVGATNLMVDMTRERHLERELQRSQRLELIGRLSSGVAHDFNNLLGVVLSLTDLARSHLPQEHPVVADLTRISEAGEQAASLAMQLLAFSKQRPATPRRIDLNRIVRRTVEMLRPTLPATITLSAQLSDGELPLMGDETQIQQVLMNLCLNARDAMPHGGELRVSTVRDDSTGPHPHIGLSVEDSGKGMTDDVCTRIFEPFFSTKEGGTGLGLAVVQQIVESHGGRIEVASTPGRGTRFEIRLPSV